MRRLCWLALLLLAGCAAAPGPETPRTVAEVDLVRYAGLWHEVARLPNRFQDAPGRECRATTASYTVRPDGDIAVVNRCESAAGPREALGRAYAVAGSGNARLRVSFFWPFYGDYWVIGLDPDYRWALVGSPGREFLWVLSRTPELAAAEEAAALSVARREGFSVTGLQRSVPTPGR
jgi:apolipoprotein D and lipocalin family protein